MRHPLESGAASHDDSQSVCLPVISETAPTEDRGEESLFGSQIEPEEDSLGKPAASLLAAQSSNGNTLGQDGQDQDERDLFGDDDDADENDLFGSDGESGGNESDLDDKGLFGSEDDEAATDKNTGDAGPGGKPPPEPSGAEPSEFDEREIFGDISDDDMAKKDVVVRRRPAPSDGRHFKSLRLPNVLSVDKTPFDAQNIAQSLLEGYQEFKSTTDIFKVKLLNPENTIRWRFKNGADGQKLMDEDGRPHYESNTRMVEWEDGTKSLFIGNQCFNVSEIDDTSIIFEENSHDVHICHGRVPGRLVITPNSLESASHTELKKTQFRKANPLRRSLLLETEESGGIEQQFYELEMEQKKRQAKQALKRHAEDSDQDGPVLMITTAFLEAGTLSQADDAASSSSSIADVNRQFKIPRSDVRF